MQRTGPGLGNIWPEQSDYNCTVKGGGHGGYNPIVLERGSKVRERTKETWALWRKSQLNPESNVQFGEGGAGTFSDGKLYSQIKDPRFLGRKVMREFVAAGTIPRLEDPDVPLIWKLIVMELINTLAELMIESGGDQGLELDEYQARLLAFFSERCIYRWNSLEMEDDS